MDTETGTVITRLNKMIILVFRFAYISGVCCEIWGDFATSRCVLCRAPGQAAAITLVATRIPPTAAAAAVAVFDLGSSVITTMNC